MGVFYTTSGQDTRMGSGSGLYIDRLKIKNQVCYCDGKFKRVGEGLWGCTKKGKNP